MVLATLIFGASTVQNKDGVMTHPKTEIVYGVAEIKKVLNVETDRRAYYMLEKGMVPGARKLGGIWALSIPTFRREFHGEVA